MGDFVYNTIEECKADPFREDSRGRGDKVNQHAIYRKKGGL
jgi:hypothetical protein